MWLFVVPAHQGTSYQRSSSRRSAVRREGFAIGFRCRSRQGKHYAPLFRQTVVGGRHTRHQHAGIRNLRAQGEPSSTPPPQVPFELRGFSLAKVVTGIGALLTVYSLYVYFKSAGSASETSLTLIYGMPILLLGLALWYAELEPVPISTTDDLVVLRERKATTTLKQIIRDVTRHRYGDEAHLSGALRVLGVIKRGDPAPVLLRLRESREPGEEYGLALVFECRETPFEAFQAVEDRIDRFFGSGIRHELRKISEDPLIVELKLITCRRETATVLPDTLKQAVDQSNLNPERGATRTPTPDTPDNDSANGASTAAADDGASAGDAAKRDRLNALSSQADSSSTGHAAIGREPHQNPTESLAPFALFGFRPTPLPGPPRQRN
jgi:hypothetical protein